MNFERIRHNHTHMNIAPLVDVVFLLLLFFMLTSHLVQEPAINVKLPESRAAEPESMMIKTITITKENEIYFMDKKLALESLNKSIAQAVTEPENDVLRIRADKDVNIGFLVKVIDEVRSAGIKNFSITTERR